MILSQSCLFFYFFLFIEVENLLSGYFLCLSYFIRYMLLQWELGKKKKNQRGKGRRWYLKHFLFYIQMNKSNGFSSPALFKYATLGFPPLFA